MVDDVGEVVGGEPVVDRHEHRADLRHGVERLELRVRVRRDVATRSPCRTPSPWSAADQRSQRSKNCSYVSRRLPSTTASRAAVQPAGAAGEIQGDSGVSMFGIMPAGTPRNHKSPPSHVRADRMNVPYSCL